MVQTEAQTSGLQDTPQHRAGGICSQRINERLLLVTHSRGFRWWRGSLHPQRKYIRVNAVWNHCAISDSNTCLISQNTKTVHFSVNKMLRPSGDDAEKMRDMATTTAFSLCEIGRLPRPPKRAFICSLLLGEFAPAMHLCALTVEKRRSH